MSEIEPGDVVNVSAADAPGRGTRVVPERFREEFSELFTPPIGGPRKPEREGLPPGFRMRADAHYVEQLTSRSADAAVRFIPTEEIDAGPPTDSADSAELEPLAHSIAARGVMQPLLVRRRGGSYEVIAGRKRLAAARAAGLARVPCLVHHVTHEETEALREAANIRVASASATSRTQSGLSLGRVVAQLAEDVAGIESSAALVGADSSPLMRRVALDLLRAQAWRASWLLRAGTILDDTYRWDFRLRRLGSALERVRQGFAPECRLSGVDLQICVPDWNVSAEVDEQGLVAGLTGAIVATLGLVGQREAAAITLIVNASAGESPSIDIAEDMDAVPAAAASRFFDPTWSDRPGGWAATIGAVAAKKVAEEHGGNAALVTRDGRSRVIRLNLGRVR